MPSIAMSLNVNQERILPALQEAAKSLDSSSREVVVDFSSVRRIDAASLRALEALIQVAESKGVRLVLRGVSIDVYKVIKLVKLTQKVSFVN